MVVSTVLKRQEQEMQTLRRIQPATRWRVSTTFVLPVHFGHFMILLHNLCFVLRQAELAPRAAPTQCRHRVVREVAVRALREPELVLIVANETPPLFDLERSVIITGALRVHGDLHENEKPSIVEETPSRIREAPTVFVEAEVADVMEMPGPRSTTSTLLMIAFSVICASRKH
jgi:hypothetical protein